MEEHVEAMPGLKKQRSKGLLIALSVFGALYLLFFVSSLIPSADGSWVSSNVPYDPWVREHIFMGALFPVFLVGYFVAFRNEWIAGVIFILWWVAMWGMDLLVMAPYGPEGGAGAGIGMGLPVFVLGILFLVNARKRARHTR